MLKSSKAELVLPDVDVGSLLEFTPGYIYWKNLDSIYLGCNQNFAHLLGFESDKDIVGKSEYEMPWAKLNSAVAEHNIKADKYVIETDRFLVTEEELSIKNEEGFPIIVRSEKRPLRDKQGKVVGIIGVSLDITKQKISENLLTDISFIIDAFSGYVVYWKDLNSVYKGCNQAFAMLTNFQTTNEIIGKTDHELFNSVIAKKYLDDDQRVIKTGERLIAEDHTGIKNSKGLEVIVRTEKKPFFDKSGNVIGVLGIAVDITDEMDLKSSEIDRDLILNSTPGYVYWKNLDSVYIGCNQEFLQVALTEDRNNVIGKTDYTLAWGTDPEVAAKFVRDDQYVINTGNSIVVEDTLVVKNSRGLTVLVRTEKKPLLDKKGNIVGVLGIAVDITDQKEAERLRLESERQQITLQEQEKFSQLARKVAHDINSPLAALKMMIPLCTEIPENKRILLSRAAEGILDIANNLLNTYHKEKHSTASDVEPRQPLLVSDLLIQLLSEKKVQYRNRSITFDTVIASGAQFAFIKMQVTEFRRSVSNLINNSVDALENNANGKVTIQLSADADAVVVEVQDNGKGLTSAMIEKMQDRRRFTEGKKSGHGLGLQQVWDTLEYNQGSMEVQSTLRKGTTIQLTFPRIAASKWIAQEIHLMPDNIIVILDDDESIHTAWNLRFTPLLTSNPALQLHHFTQGQDVLDFLGKLNQKEKNQVVFLSDYELLHQDRNGLEIVEASGIKDAILVTSYYSNPKIREATDRLGIKVLPKQMASIIPIYIDADHC